MKQFIRQLFLYGTSFTYSNLSRLFIRLFVCVLFMRFGIRHILNFNEMVNAYPSMLGMSGSSCIVVLIIIELLCALLLMLGLFTRLTCIPAILAMVYVAKSYLTINSARAVGDIADLDAMDPVYLPILFIGIFIYMILSGPGKISLDYIISVYMVNDSGSSQDDDLLQEA